MKKLNFFLLFLFAFSLLSPLFFTFWGSFINAYGVLQLPPKLFSNYTLQNYKIVISNIKGIWLLNTLWITLLTTIPSIIISTLTGYGLYLKDSKFITIVLIIIVMIPRYAIVIPQFLVMRIIGINNTLLACAIPLWISPMHILISKEFFKQFPTSIIDAGKMDGLSRFGVLFRILLPEVKPLIICLGLLKTIDAWLDYLWQYLQLTSQNAKTFFVGILGWLSDRSGGGTVNVNPIGYGLVTSILLLVPFLILFLYGNRYFMYQLGGSE